MRIVTETVDGVRIRTLELRKHEAIRDVDFCKLDVLPERMTAYFDKRWDHHLAHGCEGDPRENAFVNCARKWGVKDEAEVRQLRYLLGLPRDPVRNIVTWDRQADAQTWYQLQLAVELRNALPSDAVQIGRAYTRANRQQDGLVAEEALSGVGNLGNLDTLQQFVWDQAASDSLSAEAEVDHQMPESDTPWPIGFPADGPSVSHYINTLKGLAREYRKANERKVMVQALWVRHLYDEFLAEEEAEKRAKGNHTWRQWLNQTLDEEVGHAFLSELRLAWDEDRFGMELYEMLDMAYSLPNEVVEPSELASWWWVEQFDRDIEEQVTREGANFLSPLPPAYRGPEFWNAYMRAFLNGHSKDRALLEGAYAYAASRGFEGTIEAFFALDHTKFMVKGKDGKLFRSGKLFSDRVKKCLWKSSEAARKAYLAWKGATEPNKVNAETREWAKKLKKKWLAQQAQAQKQLAA